MPHSALLVSRMIYARFAEGDGWPVTWRRSPRREAEGSRPFFLPRMASRSKTPFLLPQEGTSTLTSSRLISLEMLLTTRRAIITSRKNCGRDQHEADEAHIEEFANGHWSPPYSPVSMPRDGTARLFGESRGEGGSPLPRIVNLCSTVQ